MTKKAKNIVLISLCGLFCFAFLLGLLFGGEELYSQSERRLLAQRPVLSLEGVHSGEYMEEVRDYVQDQFPLREGFRRLKAVTARYVLGQRVVNGLYLEQGHLCAAEEELNEAMLAYAGERFLWLYESYLEPAGSRVWLSVVPDKNYFLAAEGAYLSLDYAAMLDSLREKTAYMEYIDLWPHLSIDDYYPTDSHWRQECLAEAAGVLAAAMGAELSADYEAVTLETPFYGVYAGPSALPVAPDRLTYLTNDMLEGCIVTSYDRGLAQSIPLYDLDAAVGRDPYEVFLGGTQALVTIENPAAATERELLLFRDSFGSSLAPLLAEAYAKITLVDIRYVQSAYLENWIDFHGQDVLFLYSSTLLNNSQALR